METTQTDTIKKGDLFFTSWGYDQTNYDYIVVLETSKTGKTAKCQRTGHLNMGESGQDHVQEPIFCPFGDVFNLRIQKNYKGETQLRGSYPFLNDGAMSRGSRLDSFWRVKEGKQFYETCSMFGH